MTQTANPVTLLASPLGEEGHKVAKGVQANWIHRGAPRPANPVRRHPAKSVWTVVILIMILDVDVTAAGGIIKLIARRVPPPPSAAEPLSPPERSDATLQHNPRRKPPPQPSALRAVKPKNLPVQPFYADCLRQQATTLGAKGPVNLPWNVKDPHRVASRWGPLYFWSLGMV